MIVMALNIFQQLKKISIDTNNAFQIGINLNILKVTTYLSWNCISLQDYNS